MHEPDMTPDGRATETAVLRSIIAGNEDEARRALSEFYPGELLSLVGSAHRLTELALAEMSSREIDGVPMPEVKP